MRDPNAGCCSCSAHDDQTPNPGRRTFFAFALGLVGAMLLPLQARAKTVAVKLARLPTLAHAGGAAVATIKGLSILLIRKSDKDVVAVSSICSHQHAKLTYDPKQNQIVCPNHGSRFDLSGKVQKGPATQNLGPMYPATLDDKNGRVLITLP